MRELLSHVAVEAMPGGQRGQRWNVRTCRESALTGVKEWMGGQWRGQRAFAARRCSSESGRNGLAAAAGCASGSILPAH